MSTSGGVIDPLHYLADARHRGVRRHGLGRRTINEKRLVSSVTHNCPASDHCRKWKENPPPPLSFCAMAQPKKHRKLELRVLRERREDGFVVDVTVVDASTPLRSVGILAGVHDARTGSGHPVKELTAGQYLARHGWPVFFRKEKGPSEWKRDLPAEGIEENPGMSAAQKGESKEDRRTSPLAPGVLDALRSEMPTATKAILAADAICHIEPEGWKDQLRMVRSLGPGADLLALIEMSVELDLARRATPPPPSGAGRGPGAVGDGGQARGTGTGVPAGGEAKAGSPETSRKEAGGGKTVPPASVSAVAKTKAAASPSAAPAAGAQPGASTQQVSAQVSSPGTATAAAPPTSASASVTVRPPPPVPASAPVEAEPWFAASPLQGLDDTEPETGVPMKTGVWFDTMRWAVLLSWVCSEERLTAQDHRPLNVRLTARIPRRVHVQGVYWLRCNVVSFLAILVGILLLRAFFTSVPLVRSERAAEMVSEAQARIHAFQVCADDVACVARLLEGAEASQWRLPGWGALMGPLDALGQFIENRWTVYRYSRKWLPARVSYRFWAATARLAGREKLAASLDVLADPPSAGSLRVAGALLFLRRNIQAIDEAIELVPVPFWLWCSAAAVWVGFVCWKKGLPVTTDLALYVPAFAAVCFTQNEWSAEDYTAILANVQTLVMRTAGLSLDGHDYAVTARGLRCVFSAFLPTVCLSSLHPFLASGLPGPDLSNLASLVMLSLKWMLVRVGMIYYAGYLLVEILLAYSRPLANICCSIGSNVPTLAALRVQCARCAGLLPPLGSLCLFVQAAYARVRTAVMFLGSTCSLGARWGVLLLVWVYRAAALFALHARGPALWLGALWLRLSRWLFQVLSRWSLIAATSTIRFTAYASVSFATACLRVPRRLVGWAGL